MPNTRNSLLVFCLIISTFWLSTAAAKDSDVDEPLTIEVIVEGIEGELKANAEKFLTGKRLAETEALEPRKVRRWFKKGNEEIRSALQPFGYYHPNITSSLDDSIMPWKLVYQVAAGPETIITTLDIQIAGPGKEEPKLLQAIETFAPKRGATLVHEAYKASKEALFNALFHQGYLDTAFTRSDILVHDSFQSAEIHLHISTGKQYFFGETRVEQDILDPEFVDKYISIEPGQPFATQPIIRQKLTLDDSQYFATVEPYPQKEQADANQRIPIDIKTTPRKPRRYTWGMGYGTDTGPRVNAGVEFRRVNRKGHKVNTAALVSQVKQNANVRYRLPFKDVRSDEIIFSLRSEIDEIDDHTSQRTVFGAEMAENWWGVRRRLYLDTTFESFETSAGDESARILTPGIELSYQHLDNSIFPTRGYRWLADARVASESMLSTVNFQRFNLEAGWLRPIGDRKRLILRSEWGFIDTDDFTELPTQQRFYAGGARNVRGYGYRELGPEDDDGSSLGGSTYAFVSAEVDALFYGNFGAALFIDSGNVSELGNTEVEEERKDDGNHFSMKTSIGTGFRWKSPVGMLRLDLAQPINDDDSGWQIHFSIGPDL
jgi:translocation and assembly module TamA